MGPAEERHVEAAPRMGYPSLFSTRSTAKEGSKRGAPTDFYQKRSGIESPHRDGGRGKRRTDGGPHRAARFSEAALQRLRAALSAGAQPGSEAASMLRFVATADAPAPGLPAPSGVLSPLRRAGGSATMGRALGAGDQGVGGCGGEAGTTTELGRDGSPFSPERGPGSRSFRSSSLAATATSKGPPVTTLRCRGMCPRAGDSTRSTRHRVPITSSKLTAGSTRSNGL